MATLPFAPRGLRIVVSGTCYTSKWANVLHAQFASGTPLTNDLASLAQLIAVNFTTNMLFTSTNSMLETQCVVTDISSETGAAGIDTVQRAGAAAGTTLPAGTAMCVSWKIARRYRGGHPRTYLGGISANAQFDARQWTLSAATAQQAHALTFLGYVNTLSTPSTGNITLGSFSYYKGMDALHNPILRPVPVFDPFISTHVDQRIDSQRRRNGRPVG